MSETTTTAATSAEAPSWKSESDQRYKDLTDKLQTGMKELLSSDKYTEYLKAMSKFHNYSSRNVMLIHQQMPNATKIASFKLWDTGFNRKVKKGEKSLRIFAPTKTEAEKRMMEKLDPETGAPMRDEKGNIIMEEMTALNSGSIKFRLVPVFDVSQTYGEPLPELVEDLTGNVAHYGAFIDTLKAVSPLPIEFEPMKPEQDGYCRYGEKIGIREGMSEVQTVSAIVHEFAHARLHDRDNLSPDDKPKSKEVKEIEAESISYVVCQKYGIETGANSFGYLATWGSHDMKEIQASLDTIRKEANTFINAIDSRFATICKERGIDLNPAKQEAGPPEQAQPTPEKPEYTIESTTESIAGVEFTVSEVVPTAPMAIQRRNYEKLAELFPKITSGDYYYQKSEAGDGFMPLSLEWTDTNRLSVMHTYVQNGDLMYDPMIVLKVDKDAKTATAVEFQQSNPPLYQRIDDGIGYSVDGNGNQRTISGLQGQLNDFVSQWADNIGKQGYEPVSAILSDAERVDPSIYFNEDKKPFGLAFVYDSEGTTVFNHQDKDDKGNMAKIAYVSSYRDVNFFEDKLPETVISIVETVKLNNEKSKPQEVAEPEQPSEPMPDQTIAAAGRDDFGYTADDMLPLNADRAAELFNQDHTIYLLYSDNTEAMVFDSSEIAGHDGIFGIEREDWQKSQEYRDMDNKTNQQQQEEAPEPHQPVVELPTAPDIPKSEQPIYRFSADYALEKDELQSWRDSRDLNVECGKAIDKAISDNNYELHRYDLKAAARDVIAEFGADRVAWVVAANIHDNNFDGRLSAANKDWAKEFDVSSRPDYHLKTHLAVLDGFAQKFREVEKEKPSLMAALKTGEEKSKREHSNSQPKLDTPEKTKKKTGMEV